MRKAAEQRELVTSQEDVRILRRALSAFTSLQHVQILRLQDEPDQLLLDHLRDDAHASRHVDLQWTPACVHGTRTMGEALLVSGSPFTRFSGPMMNPQSAMEMGKVLPETVHRLARQLTCLELHFDESTNLDERMRGLSGLFKDVFTAARSMLAVHLGFPSRAPLGLSLEQIFHGVQWERLRAFGIQAWRLRAEEIIGLVRRHRKTLRGLRLRDVLLKDPDRWTTVLEMLRNEMDYLDWVSLRRIGYARTFDERTWGTGEVLPDLFSSASESDDEAFPTHLGADHAAEDNDHLPGDHSTEQSPHDEAGIGDSQLAHDEDHYHDYGDEEESEENDDDDDDDDDEDEHGPEPHELAMDPDTPNSGPWCNCSCRVGGGGGEEGGVMHDVNSSSGIECTLETLTAADLGDDGREVENWQRKMWERWVLGVCHHHRRHLHHYNHHNHHLRK